MIELKAGASRLGIYPHLGGSLAYWTQSGEDILHPVADPNLRAQRNKPVAGYPLLPFSNRIANAAFDFEGHAYHLNRNFAGEPHAIHGNGWEREWALKFLEESSATLELDHNVPPDPQTQWPFSYRAELNFVLRMDSLVIHMAVENTDHRAQPVGFGYHPFFPSFEEVELGFSAQKVWENGPDHLPSRLVDVKDSWSFETMRALADTGLDNCYCGWGGSAFLRWPRHGRSLTITASDIFSHLVVFNPLNKPFLAVEPVTNMTDAIHHMNLPDHGLRILQPGEQMGGYISLSLSAL